jgi:hypothetical protein
MEGKGRDQEAPSAREGPPSITEQVFAYWGQTLKHPRAILDPKRRKLLDDRIREGMTLEEGLAVVDGAVRDAQSWPERARFNGIEYLFENRGTVEKFIDLATKFIRPKDGHWTAESQKENRAPPGEVKDF